jgi:hypothetical protein
MKKAASSPARRCIVALPASLRALRARKSDVAEK